MIPATHHRLLTRGDLPDSGGGLYNPGAWYDRLHNTVYASVRHEADYSWTQPCRASFIQVTRDLTTHALGRASVPFLGFDAGTRFEDLRPFVWRDQVLISHVAYQPNSGKPVRQRLSKLRPDWSAIERWSDWGTLHMLQDIEKNWALVGPGDDLYTVYSLSPFLLLKRYHPDGSGGWARYGSDQNQWAASLGHEPRCSTHLLPWRDGYLGWWHCRIDGVYVQGAYWLDRDLRLRRRSGILFDGQEIGYTTDGGPLDTVASPVYKPGVFYLSSQVDRGDDLWLFYGVGDAHSNVAVVKADDVDRFLR